MEALLKMQSAPTTTFNDQMALLAKCIANKENLDTPVCPAKDFEARVQSFVNRANSASRDVAARPEHHATAESILELVKITEQLSKLEKVAEQTRGCEAVSEDAKKWQDLTSVDLVWSLKSLCDQQRASVQKLSGLLNHNPVVKDAPKKSASPAMQHPPSSPPPPPPGPAVEDNPGGAKAAPSATGFEQGETLRTHLETLASEDPNRILIVRRINRLGFDSPLHLENKFAEFGPVTRVFVAHSRVKPSTKRPQPRVRPAGLGFVLMGSTEDASNIANSGPQMLINNVSVEVKLYKPGSMGTGKGEGEGEVDEE